MGGLAGVGNSVAGRSAAGWKGAVTPGMTSRGRAWEGFRGGVACDRCAGGVEIAGDGAATEGFGSLGGGEGVLVADSDPGDSRGGGSWAHAPPVAQITSSADQTDEARIMGPSVSTVDGAIGIASRHGSVIGRIVRGRCPFFTSHAIRKADCTGGRDQARACTRNRTLIHESPAQASNIPQAADVKRL